MNGVARRLHLVFLLLLVGSATAARMAYAYWVHAPGNSVYSDMGVYYGQAVHLREGTLSPQDTLFPMGYSALIAAASAVSSHPLRLVGAAQAVAGGLTCLLAYLLARRASLSPAWSLVAASFVALYPPFVFYGSMLLTESVSPFLFTLVMWLMFRVIDTRRWEWAVALGLTFATASVVRSNFLPFAAVIAACVWLGVNRQSKTTAILLAITAAAALPLLVLACSVNSTLTGRWSGPSTNGGLNFFMMQAEVRGVRYYDGGVGPIRNVLKYTGVFESPAPLYDESYYYGEGIRLIRADPWRAAARAADGIRESLGLGLQTFWPASGVSKRSPSPVYVVMLPALDFSARAFAFLLVLPSVVAVVALAARGMLFDRERLIWLALAGALALMCFTSIVFLADPRMHVPFDALLIVTGVAAARWAWERAVISLQRQRPIR